MNAIPALIDDKKSQVLGHPAGLFVLFFTEMWERFSYYGMRVLLVIFLVSAVGIDGLGWPRANALALYGTYTSLVYLTPIAGGYLADRFMGYRNAVVTGALIMTLGHAAMALEIITPVFLYIGIGLLIIGNGFFKPNITSIISGMYKRHPGKKDSAYTIFYAGVNAGAFLGTLLCGYLGEEVGWHYGFGLAGIFMLLGMLQFYFARHIFGPIGKTPKPQQRTAKPAKLEFKGGRLTPFTRLDKTLIALSTLIGVVWVINDPLSKIAGFNMLKIGSADYADWFILLGLTLFLFLLVSRTIRYPTLIRDRMCAIALFLLFTTLFFACFEQAGGTLNIFAKDYTNRIMRGNWALAFNIINTIITVIPCGIITWVLFALFRKTFKNYAVSNLFLGFSFLIIWGLLIWKLNRDLHARAYVISYPAVKTQRVDKKPGDPLFDYRAITQDEMGRGDLKNPVTQQTTLIDHTALQIGEQVAILDADKRGNYTLLTPESALRIEKRAKGLHTGIVTGQVTQIKENEVEIPATWFGILNSLFIIVFAPLFSKWWASRYNPSAATKYALGLILLGLGFLTLALGSRGIGSGAQAAAVSGIYLVVAYLFHTLGELSLSPVGLSYVSKLVPGRMIAMMFGIFFITSAIGNKLAGQLGGMIDKITAEYSMSAFFLIFTLSPIALGLLALALNPLIKKLMHGVK
ncbi:MAG: peptide MFS transporter [Flavobacteriales bacterium]